MKFVPDHSPTHYCKGSNYDQWRFVPDTL